MTAHFSRWKKTLATASLPLLLGASSVALSACQGEEEPIGDNGGIVEDGGQQTEEDLFGEESPSPSPAT